jgi:DtxR family Mn-dependent transcriptional regulator
MADLAELNTLIGGVAPSGTEPDLDFQVTPAIEEYLETIHNLTTEGKPAIGARLAERLNIKAASVVGMIKELQKKEYVTQDDHTKELHLTEKGEKIANSLARRHRLVERLLVDVLQLSWDEAHDEACRLEHHISAQVERALIRYLNNPTTCPHGNPIPGSGGVIRSDSRTLDGYEPGANVVIDHVGEDAEHEPGLLKFLQQHNLVPGVQFEVKGSIMPFNETLVLLNGFKEEVTLGKKIAGKIWAVPV